MEVKQIPRYPNVEDVEPTVKLRRADKGEIISRFKYCMHKDCYKANTPDWIVRERLAARNTTSMASYNAFRIATCSQPVAKEANRFIGATLASRFMMHNVTEESQDNLARLVIPLIQARYLRVVMASVDSRTVQYITEPQDAQVWYGRLAKTGTTSHAFFDHGDVNQFSLVRGFNEEFVLARETLEAGGDENDLVKKLEDKELNNRSSKFPSRNPNDWTDIRCPSGHHLSPLQPRETSSWNCDVCFRRSSPSDNARTCLTCNYDICPTCSDIVAKWFFWWYQGHQVADGGAVARALLHNINPYYSRFDRLVLADHPGGVRSPIAGEDIRFLYFARLNYRAMREFLNRAFLRTYTVEPGANQDFPAGRWSDTATQEALESSNQRYRYADRFPKAPLTSVLVPAKALRYALQMYLQLMYDGVDDVLLSVSEAYHGIMRSLRKSHGRTMKAHGSKPWLAVSYRWGKMHKPLCICQAVQLGQMLPDDDDIWVWLDVIAVNQEDDTLKAQDLQDIPLIYACAQAVLLPLHLTTLDHQFRSANGILDVYSRCAGGNVLGMQVARTKNSPGTQVIQLDQVLEVGFGEDLRWSWLPPATSSVMQAYQLIGTGQNDLEDVLVVPDFSYFQRAWTQFERFHAGLYSGDVKQEKKLVFAPMIMHWSAIQCSMAYMNSLNSVQSIFARILERRDFGNPRFFEAGDHELPLPLDEAYKYMCDLAFRLPSAECVIAPACTAFGMKVTFGRDIKFILSHVDKVLAKERDEVARERLEQLEDPLLIDFCSMTRHHIVGDFNMPSGLRYCSLEHPLDLSKADPVEALVREQAPLTDRNREGVVEVPRVFKLPVPMPLYNAVLGFAGVRAAWDFLNTTSVEQWNDTRMCSAVFVKDHYVWFTIIDDVAAMTDDGPPSQNEVAEEIGPEAVFTACCLPIENARRLDDKFGGGDTSTWTATISVYA